MFRPIAFKINMCLDINTLNGCVKFDNNIYSSLVATTGTNFADGLTDSLTA